MSHFITNSRSSDEQHIKNQQVFNKDQTKAIQKIDHSVIKKDTCDKLKSYSIKDVDQYQKIDHSDQLKSYTGNQTQVEISETFSSETSLPCLNDNFKPKVLEIPKTKHVVLELKTPRVEKLTNEVLDIKASDDVLENGFLPVTPASICKHHNFAGSRRLSPLDNIFEKDNNNIFERKNIKTKQTFFLLYL